MNFLLVFIFFVIPLAIAIALLMRRDEQRRKGKYNRCLEVMDARTSLTDLEFKNQIGTKLQEREITETRECIAKYFRLEKDKIYPSDDLFRDYGVEMSDDIEGLYDDIEDFTGIDLEPLVPDEQSTVKMIFEILENEKLAQPVAGGDATR